MVVVQIVLLRKIITVLIPEVNANYVINLVFSAKDQALITVKHVTPQLTTKRTMNNVRHVM